MPIWSRCAARGLDDARGGRVDDGGHAARLGIERVALGRSSHVGSPPLLAVDGTRRRQSRRLQRERYSSGIRASDLVRELSEARGIAAVRESRRASSRKNVARTPIFGRPSSPEGARGASSSKRRRYWPRRRRTCRSTGGSTRCRGKPPARTLPDTPETRNRDHTDGSDRRALRRRVSTAATSRRIAMNTPSSAWMPGTTSGPPPRSTVTYPTESGTGQLISDERVRVARRSPTCR